MGRGLGLDKERESGGVGLCFLIEYKRKGSVR